MRGLLMKTKPGVPEDQIEKEAERLRALWERYKRVKAAEGIKVTQADIADQLGWKTQGNFSHLLNGRQPIPLETLFDLAVSMEFDPREVRPSIQGIIDKVFKSVRNYEPSLFINSLRDLSADDQAKVADFARYLSERALSAKE